MTLLTIVTNVCDEIGIARPASVIGSSDQTARQLLALANKGGRILARRGRGVGGWTVLTKEREFTSTADEDDYALPTDFEYFVDETAWDKDNYWRLRGPLSAQEWRYRKNGLATSGPHSRFRGKPGANVRRYFLDPTPTTATP